MSPNLQATINNLQSLPEDPIEAAARCLAAGVILAIKGLGGYHLACDALNAPAGKEKAKPGSRPAPAASKGRAAGKKKARFTPRQGQFLAFIHLYRKLHRQGPAEQEMVSYFGVTPPTVHAMVVKLQELGLIAREPGVARSVRVAIPEAEIPSLQAVEGPSWGLVALANVVRGPWQNATLGYWIDRSVVGRGHASRAVRLVLAYAFEHVGLHRVQPAIIPRNAASQRVAAKVGFRLEGRALRYLKINGVWEDHDIYALTAEDWRAMQTRP